MKEGSLWSSSGTQSTNQLSQEIVSDSGPLPAGVLAEEREWFRREFRPHFDEWVFGPIDRLVSSPDALVAFVLMACAIDYLAGFWWGESTQGVVKKAYTEFIDRYFPPGQYDAAGLYDSLRNGLVHMFTIKGQKYTLTHNNPALHLQTSASGQIILNAADFRDDLVAAKERFFDEVEANPDLLSKVLERYTRDGFLDSAELGDTQETRQSAHAHR